MSDEDKSNGDSKQVFLAFADLLAKQAKDQNRRDDKRAAENNTALLKLTDSVDELTKQHIESKKDQEFNSLRMNRYEVNQTENNATLKNISETLVLLGERVNNNKGWIYKAAEIITLVVIAVVTTLITTRVS